MFNNMSNKIAYILSDDGNGLIFLSDCGRSNLILSGYIYTRST